MDAERCLDCSALVEVQRLEDGLCKGCASAVRASLVWSEWDRMYRAWSDNDAAASGDRW